MFKKSIEARSQQRLSGADKKKLRRTVRDKFPRASDADIDALLPPKVEMTVTKLSNRACIYGIEGGFPMFFDVDGRGSEIFPTVYALWQVPELLPSFMLKGGGVSHYIIGGADLMFPGISVPSEGLPSFLAGEQWSVTVPGNKAPIAVGVTTMSSSEATKAGLRGKAVRITHHYPDSLWNTVEGHYVPNAGFFENVVLEDPALSLASTTGDVCEEAVNDTENDVGTLDHEGSVDVSEVSSKINVDRSAHDEVGVSNHEELTADIKGLNISDGASVEEIIKEQPNLSPEEIDSLLDRCFLQALHTSVKDKDLPLAGSMLWSGHVLPCRPPGTTMDIKKSSHKKLSKWLQSKSSTGLITVKEDKHKKEVVLLSVNRLHPEYTSFRPEKQQVEVHEQFSSSLAGDASQRKLQFDVVELYKPSTHLNPIFVSVGADPAQFYSTSEATDIVFRYIENEKLVKPTNKATVVLDATLCDALYKGTVKKGSAYPTEIHKKDLGATFLKRMQVHHKVTRENESTIRKGVIKTIQILTERRQGNKKMTRVSGLESFLIDPESLASELQKKFACSTTVAELPGKKGHEVLVQGGVIQDLAKHLVDHYAVPKRYIEILDKTKR